MARILVVEDNESNIYLIRFLLEKHGHEVIEARTGREGVRLALEASPDLILMDIQLPDITGEEATRLIRESPADGDIPIIALTSYAMAGDRERFLAAGCTGYIEKPIDPYGVLAEIERHLR